VEKACPGASNWICLREASAETSSRMNLSPSPSAVGCLQGRPGPPYWEIVGAQMAKASWTFRTWFKMRLLATRYPPSTRHAVHLREAVAGQEVLLQLRDGGQAETGVIVVDQEIVGLIRHDKKVLSRAISARALSSFSEKTAR